MYASTTSNFGMMSKAIGVAALAGSLFVSAPAPVAAQGLAVSAGVDFPSLYYFRGYRQEAGPALTMWPWIDLGIPIMEGDGAIQSATLNVGTWNSIHTGTNSDPEYYDGSWYESDFYATLGLGLSGWTLATTYTAYMYPAPDFDSIHEIAFKGTVSHMLAPYGMIAFEFADCDGCPKGTYLELGVGPTFALTAEEGGPSLTVPVKIGFDVKDYYAFDEEGFGFFSVGGTVTYPLPEQSWGTWGLRGGLEVLALSETLEGVNFDDDFETNKVGFVGFGGITFSF